MSAAGRSGGGAGMRPDASDGPRRLDASAIARLRYNEAGLVPVVAQDHVTGQVLMLAWSDVEALRASLETGWMTYWSRSRQALWEKGATSGHRQRLVSLHVDCDGDAVLALVEQEGPACHTGDASCWCTDVEPAGMLGRLDRIAARRQQAPEGRYTDQLLADAAKAAGKVEEEAGELGQVLRGEPNDDGLEHEAADLLYHLVVAVRAGGGRLEDVLRELARRHRAD